MTGIIPLKHKPVSADFTAPVSLGSAVDAESGMRWMSAHILPVLNEIRERVVVLDYGCGRGRVGNYLSGILTEFTYYGLEQPTEHGREMIELARKTYPDRRLIFDFCDTDSENERAALSTSEIIILASVFTHTHWDETIRILDKFIPALQRGGTVVFSCILRDFYEIKGEKIYGNPRGTAVTFNTISQYEDYARDRGLTLRRCSEYDLGGGLVQTIMSLRRKDD